MHTSQVFGRETANIKIGTKAGMDAQRVVKSEHAYEQALVSTRHTTPSVLQYPLPCQNSTEHSPHHHRA